VHTVVYEDLPNSNDILLVLPCSSSV